MEQKAQQLLNSFPEEKRILAEKVREILLQSSKKLSETIKWRQLTYVSGKANIAFIYTYKTTAYINLAFFNATSLDDPRNLFEGTGKGMRHLKIASEKDIRAVQIKKWVIQALEIRDSKRK